MGARCNVAARRSGSDLQPSRIGPSHLESDKGGRPRERVS